MRDDRPETATRPGRPRRELAALRRAFARLEADRDAEVLSLSRSVDEVQAALREAGRKAAAARRQIGDLTAERDRAVQEAGRLGAERDEALAIGAHLTAERDAARAETDAAAAERDRLAAALAAAEARIGELEDEAEAQRAALAGCEAETVALCGEIEALRGMVDRANARVAAIEASTSWRMTAPVRAVLTLLRRRDGG